MTKKIPECFSDAVVSATKLSKDIDKQSAIRKFGGAVGMLDLAFIDKENLSEALANLIVATIWLCVAYPTKIPKQIKQKSTSDSVGWLHSIRMYLTRMDFENEDLKSILNIVYQIISENNLNFDNILTLTINKINNHGKAN